MCVPVGRDLQRQYIRKQQKNWFDEFPEVLCDQDERQTSRFACSALSWRGAHVVIYFPILAVRQNPSLSRFWQGQVLDDSGKSACL